MKKYHDVTDAKAVAGFLHLTVDGKTRVVELARVSLRLANAPSADQARLVVSASGYGIHWPTVDEDLTVDGLIRCGKPVRKKATRRTRVPTK